MNVERKKLRLDDLVLSPSLCPRAELSGPHTMALAEAVMRGCILPPLKVIQTEDGRLLLYGGYHTYRALRLLEEVEAVCDVAKGTFSDAVWLSCLENSMYGRQRTRLDTYVVVKRALSHPKAARMSYADIAMALNVPLGMVMYIARHRPKARHEEAKTGHVSCVDCLRVKLHIDKLKKAIDDVVAGKANVPGANLVHAKVFQKLLAAMREEVERWDTTYGDKTARLPGKGDREDTRVH